MTTCTVSRVASQGSEPCGEPAVYVEESRVTPGLILGECARHAAQHGSLASTVHMVAGAGRRQVGDTFPIHRCGRDYIATVTKVGKRGAVYATFTYGNGATREVGRDGGGDVHGAPGAPGDAGRPGAG